MISFCPMVTVKGRDGIDMGALICDALAECRMQHKSAWADQGYPDGSQWSKALKGQAPLDLWNMRHLPNKFWQAFLPMLGSALIKQFFEDVTSDFRMAKADLKHDEQQKRSA